MVLLGSTGSVGTQAVDVVARNRDRFRVVGLAAGGRRLQILAEQTLDLQPAVVAVARGGAEEDFRAALQQAADARGLRAGQWPAPEVLTGAAGVEQVAAWPAHTVLNAVDGALGLASTMGVLRAGSVLALANKESLIVGGRFVTEAAAPGQIVPVDSEHSAIAQALRSGTRAEVAQLVITATGGPFRGRTRAQLADVSVAQAMAHPTWSMGQVITINSSTLINKGLEVIEAHHLFALDFDQIAVVGHPQSRIHSMVEFVDGSTIAQVSPPDMRLAISLGLGWPERVPAAAQTFDWTQPETWDLFPLDHETFPAVQLAYQVGRAGGSAPAVYNAANEVCVRAFIDRRLPWLGIVDTVARVVADLGDPAVANLDDVLAADAWARRRSNEFVEV
nr:1-deoxy-D-xylulose-5-phosphate reductoisomerase [Kineococcus radiotolerans]